MIGQVCTFAALLPASVGAQEIRPAPAEGPAPGTLADAIALAYRNNPTLQATRYDVRGADERIAQAESELRATAALQLSGGYDLDIEGRVSERRNFFSPRRSERNRSQVALSIEQPLYTSGRATADRAAARASLGAARAGLRGTEGDLLLAVIGAYLDVRRFAAEVEIRDGSVAELQRLEREIEARQQAGELTRTDVAQARGQIALAEAQAVQTREALESARADFVSLVGAEPRALAAPTPLAELPRDAAAAYDLAERNSPELARARFTETASRQQIVSARAAGGPTVSLRGTASVNGRLDPYVPHDQDQSYSGGVVFTLPLSAGGRTASQIREAQARNSGDRLRIEAARRELARSVQGAWNGLVAADRTAASVEARRAAATTQLEGMLAEYRVGLRSTFDILYAQQTLRDAEVATLDTRRDQYLARAMLLRRIGMLEISRIATGIAPYDPDANLRRIRDENRLLWDGAFRAFDALGKPAPHRRALTAPPPAQAPALVPGDPAAPADSDYATGMPLAPYPGTMAEAPQGTRP